MYNITLTLQMIPGLFIQIYFHLTWQHCFSKIVINKLERIKSCSKINKNGLSFLLVDIQRLHLLGYPINDG